MSPEEVEYAQGDIVLRQYLDEWKMQPDGTATLRALTPFNQAWLVMELFIEGLEEGMFLTYNVSRAGVVEIIEVDR